MRRLIDRSSWPPRPRETSDEGLEYASYLTLRPKPRVVDAKIKVGHEIGAEKCRISGDLYVVESCNLHLRYAQVRDGNLLLYRYLGQNKELDIRIPLYNLSINLGFSTQNGRFSLTRYSDLTPLATFQVVRQSEYEQWLKALAVEIIRQTPLNTLKFLDILFVDQMLQQSIRRSPRSTPAAAQTCASGDPHSQPRRLPKPQSGRVRGHVDDDDKTTEMVRSIDSLDSGFHSLPAVLAPSAGPPSSHREDAPPKLFAEIRRKFEKRCAKPKSKPSGGGGGEGGDGSSCFNLRQKIKKLNCTENESGGDGGRDAVPAKTRPVGEPAQRVPREEGDAAPRRSSTRPRSCDGSLASRQKAEASAEPAAATVGRAAEAAGELLRNEELRLLIRLLAKCQIEQQYVPVREKRLLFEPLNRFSFSVENLERRRSRDGAGLSRSLSFDTLRATPTPVKAIRDYFESLKNETPDGVTV